MALCRAQNRCTGPRTFGSWFSISASSLPTDRPCYVVRAKEGGVAPLESRGSTLGRKQPLVREVGAD